jgi:hypothetical protein
MKYDTFLSTIDGWGHYQKVKFIFVCFTYMVPPIMVYTWSFTAATPDFRCHYPSEIRDTSNALLNQLYRPTEDECAYHQKSISPKECERCYRKTIPSNNSITSHLQTCDDYIFDRSVYEKTLVEEVSFFTNVCFDKIHNVVSVVNGMRSSSLSICCSNNLFYWFYVWCYIFRYNG